MIRSPIKSKPSGLSPSPPETAEPDKKELTAFLGAVSLFLAAVEYLIPKPVPYIRLGISNIPILLALPLLSNRYILLLALAKTLGQALLNGTLMSYVFLLSLSGTFSSTIMMILLYRTAQKYFSFLGISLWGSLVNSLVQIAVSLKWILGPQAVALIPWILFSGFTGGLLVGGAGLAFSRNSLWYQTLQKKLFPLSSAKGEDGR